VQEYSRAGVYVCRNISMQEYKYAGVLSMQEYKYAGIFKGRSISMLEYKYAGV